MLTFHSITSFFLFLLSFQAKARAARSLIRLIDGKHLPGSREKSVLGDESVWPQAMPAPVVKDQTAGVLDSSSLLSSVEAGEARRVSRRDAPTVLVVREGSVVVNLQDGTRRTVREGACWETGERESDESETGRRFLSFFFFVLLLIRELIVLIEKQCC